MMKNVGKCGEKVEKLRKKTYEKEKNSKNCVNSKNVEFGKTIESGVFNTFP